MRNLLNHWTIKSALSLGITLASTGIAFAQAAVTAQRGAELSTFVQTTLLRPDWRQTNNIGFSAGVDYTRYTRSTVQPSLELRYSTADGKNVGEHTFTGGFKFATTMYGLHPYGTLLAGTGGITFHNPIDTYGSDTSFVYSLGGGAEFNVRPQWKMRVDFTQQHWNLNPQLLTPMTFSIGVVYKVPFGGGGWEH